MEEGWCTATVEEGKNVRSDSQEKGGAQRRSRRAETVEREVLQQSRKICAQRQSRGEMCAATVKED